MRKAIQLSIILIGFTAMASQIIYMRELLIVFYGNELSISFILASWLIAGAIGSALLGRFTDLPSLRGPTCPPKPNAQLIRRRRKGRSNLISVFSLCQIILAISLPLGIVAARMIKPALNVNPGQVLPLFPIIALSFLILAPICIILGFMFSLACSIYHLHSGGVHSGGVNRPARHIW